MTDKVERIQPCVHLKWSHPMECETRTESEAPLKLRVEKFLYQICEHCGITRRVDER